jgi:dinuclear metal center YbgI/SA1388 family protein
MKTNELAAFLDRELKVDAFKDVSNNGLQVENTGSVKRVCCGVDASMQFFEAAADRGADFLICHHGISWGNSLSRITDLNFDRVRYLIDRDMALYACHLPLDAHPVHGNNALICRALGVTRLKPFGCYDGVTIGFAGRLSKPIRYSAFKNKIQRVMQTEPQSMDFGKRTVSTVAVVSGGAADGVSEAAAKNMDVYVTGEPRLSAYSVAQEKRINAVFAGHYATEVFGVRALGELITRQFKMPSDFIRFNVPF